MTSKRASTLSSGNGNGYSNGNGNGNGHGRELVPIFPAPQVVDDGDDFDLGSLLTILRRRAVTFLGVAALSAGSLTLWHLSRPPAYRGSLELLVEPVTVVNELELGATVTPESANRGLDYSSQIRVLRSPTVLNPILQSIQQRYPQITYGELLANLSISRVGDSKVLQVAYNDADPEVVKFVLAQLADGFIDYSVENRQGDLRRGLSFVDEQLQQKRQEVDVIEAELNRFQKQHDLVNIDAVSASVTERLNQMLAQQESLWVEMAALETLYSNLQAQVGMPPNSAMRIASLNESPAYQNLLAELHQIEQEIALESARFQAGTPMIQALEDRRQQLLPLLEAEAQRVLGVTTTAPQAMAYQGAVDPERVQELTRTLNQIQVLQTRDQAITAVIGSLQGEVERLSDLSRAMKQIQRELTAAENSLNQLLANRQDLQFQIARQASPWELMSPLAQTSAAPITNLPRKLVLSTVISVLLGGAAALLHDKLDKVFHSADELADATQLPNLASIPYTAKLQNQSLLIDRQLTSSIDSVLAQSQPSKGSYASLAFAETFYSLDANLRLLSSDTPVQAVTVTSSLPGEGKSTTAAHLAIAATHMGRRVLLIDGDLRQPSLHEFFGLPNDRGLSDFISQNQEFTQDMARPLPDNPYLHLITAGTRPPAPGRLLSSNRMQHIVAACRHAYDLIIFDTPPLMGINDAKLIAAQADGMLLVTRLSKTPRAEVGRVLSDLGTTVQAPVLGMVVNGVSSSRRQGYYSGYYGQTVANAGV